MQKERLMSDSAVVSNNVIVDQRQPDAWRRAHNSALPAAITREASKQTYYTIRFLVDRDRVVDTYRAYAYFRWVDDQLDQEALEQSERLAFVERQQALVDGGYRGERRYDLTVEECMLAELIRSDQEQNSGLQAYIRNMMAVMAFDADRRGRLISAAELAEYTQHLSVGVTEALHYFIGHDDPSPRTQVRYLAVTAAHITHMLRDTFEDIAAGYFNLPREFLEAHGIGPCEVGSDAYQAWVKSRVQLARDYFKLGGSYLAQVKNLRCRLAGYTYIARYEKLLAIIEREGYQLRPAYPECQSLKAGLTMGAAVLSMMLKEVV
jgi:phytoene/squalene synthetase